MSSKQKIKVSRRLDVRLTLRYSCAFLITTFIICAFLYYRIRHNLLKDIDRVLFDEGREITASLLRSGKPNNEEMTELVRENTSRKFYPLHFRIMDTAGNVQFVSREKAFRSITAEKELWKQMTTKKGITKTVYRLRRKYPKRVYTFPVYQDNRLSYVVQITTTLKLMNKSLKNFRFNIIQAFPLALLLGALGGWLLARGSLKPIGEVTRTTRRITASNLTERIAVNHTGDELDELIITINDMISRIEDAFKRIAQFTADASHELRTPLCSLKGEIEVILSQERDREEYKKTLIDCAERLEELVKLLNGLLFLARADGGAVINMAPLSLDELLTNLSEFFDPLAKQKGITLSLDSVEKARVIGDKTLLQQLFTNLIDNAIKYTPEGGRISIGMHADREMVEVFVKDTGIGIPEDDLTYIFKRFYRVDHSRSREAGGSGLGLSICHFIVEAHHGRIKVESEVNQGSTFTVYLPRTSSH
ncbi:MAG TPA: heavy metal sensor histidine kinase [Thermodesulfobacteriota bacterium]|nr:heavy metal sensor histidine kinase [Thermodesulfobacteriota bacterium]